MEGKKKMEGKKWDLKTLEFLYMIIGKLRETARNLDRCIDDGSFIYLKGSDLEFLGALINVLKDAKKKAYLKVEFEDPPFFCCLKIKGKKNIFQNAKELEVFLKEKGW